MPIFNLPNLFVQQYSYVYVFKIITVTIISMCLMCNCAVTFINLFHIHSYLLSYLKDLYSATINIQSCLSGEL